MGKDFNETIFFSTYLYKLGKILLCQVVEDTLLLQEKFFNWLLKRAFQKIMNKNLENFQIFQSFFYI